MNIALPIVVATALLAAVGGERCTQHTTFNPQQDLLARLVRVVGAQAKDCGQLEPPGTWGRLAPDTAAVESPIHCSVVAASELQPFFMVLRTPGFDSWTAMGLLGGADGILQSFTYDSLYGQGVLRVKACSRPRGILTPDGFVLIECDSPQANIQMQLTRRMTLAGAQLIWRR